MMLFLSEDQANSVEAMEALSAIQSEMTDKNGKFEKL